MKQKKVAKKPNVSTETTIKAEEAATYEIESVNINDKKLAEDGTELVRVKWVGFDEETYEPVSNIVVPEQTPNPNTVDESQKTAKKRGTKQNKLEPLAKRQKTTGIEIDYMQHSLMNDEQNLVTSTSSFMSNIPVPQNVKKTNAARARRENISIEDQVNRSAEMRDLVLQDTNQISTIEKNTETQIPPIADKNLYYSGTDSDTALPVRAKPVATTEKVSKLLFPYKKPPTVKKTDAISPSEQASGTNAVLRHLASNESQITKAMREENWAENSALENAKDEGQQPIRGAHVCHSTYSTEMQERNYKTYGINSFFRDTQFAEDVGLERKLMGEAVRNLCRANKEDETCKQALLKSSKQIENAGLGKALVSVHSLCASANARRQQQNSDQLHNLTSSKFEYPLQTDIRCFYDHHRFTGIPIFIPLAFSNTEREMVSILSSICFCSFSCAKSWIREKAPSGIRSDASDIMLTIFARKYFGITEEIKPAQPLIMHEDYGGILNTKQWRSMGTTHHSTLRQPLCVAAPSTVIAEVYVRSRKDVGKVARIAKRTEETHFSSVPERPERNTADAAEASKRKLKEGEGRPLKQRQTVDAQGNRVTLDEEYLEKRIAAGIESRNAKKSTKTKTVNPTQEPAMMIGAKIVQLPVSKKPTTTKPK